MKTSVLRPKKLPIRWPTVDELDTLFAAFADPTRIRILNVLAAGELCVCDLVDLLAQPQPTISRHLTILRTAGLVLVARRWKYAHYRLAPPSTDVHSKLTECVRSCFVGIGSLDHERRTALERIQARANDPCR